MAKAQGPIPSNELTDFQMENLRGLNNYRRKIFDEINDLLEKHGLNLFVRQIIFTSDREQSAEAQSAGGGCCCPDGYFHIPCNNCEGPVIIFLPPPPGEGGDDLVTL